MSRRRHRAKAAARGYRIEPRGIPRRAEIRLYDLESIATAFRPGSVFHVPQTSPTAYLEARLRIISEERRLVRRIGRGTRRLMARQHRHR